MEKSFAVYILANRPRGTIYIGLTNNIVRRLEEHRNGRGGRFTAIYRNWTLVHLESFDCFESAVNREKELKGWRRQKKVRLIEQQNRDWAGINLVAYFSGKGKRFLS